MISATPTNMKGTLMGELLPRAEQTPDELLNTLIDYVLGDCSNDDEYEKQPERFIWLVFELAVELGGCWGYGHMGNDPAAWARSVIIGESTWEDPNDQVGIPSLHTALREKYNERFPA